MSVEQDDPCLEECSNPLQVAILEDNNKSEALAESSSSPTNHRNPALGKMGQTSLVPWASWSWKNHRGNHRTCHMVLCCSVVPCDSNESGVDHREQGQFLARVEGSAGPCSELASSFFSFTKLNLTQ